MLEKKNVYYIPFIHFAVIKSTVISTYYGEYNICTASIVLNFCIFNTCIL